MTYEETVAWSRSALGRSRGHRPGQGRSGAEPGARRHRRPQRPLT